MKTRKLHKLLGLAILAIVAVMAVNASAAQAKWLLVNPSATDGVEQLLLNLNLNVLLGEMLITPLGAHIHCEKGTGLVALQTNTKMEDLTGVGHVTFEECIVTGFPHCEVKSPGLPAGQIFAEGSGLAEMNATEVFSNLSSEEFTEVIFENALCPFNENEAPVHGTVKLSLPGAATSAATHTGSVDDVSLFYGEETAVLHGVNLTTPVAVHATREGGGNWAIQLTGL